MLKKVVSVFLDFDKRSLISFTDRGKLTPFKSPPF